MLASCFLQWELTPESVIEPLAAAIIHSEGPLPRDTVLELLWCMSRLRPGDKAVFRRLVSAAVLHMGPGDEDAQQTDWA